MPLIGLGLHVLVALFFAIHAVRSGQNSYWLFILFSFPLLGSVVYFFAIYMPQSRLEHGAARAIRAATKILDPQRELREAQAAFDYAPTAQNQMRLAQALLEGDRASDAADAFEACLNGPFAEDLDIRLGAARASLECGRGEAALAHVARLQDKSPEFRSGEVSLLRARILASLGRDEEAGQAFEFALQRFGSFDIIAEYAIWAIERADAATADRLMARIGEQTRHWNRATRDRYAPQMRRVEAAVAARAKA